MVVGHPQSSMGAPLTVQVVVAAAAVMSAILDQEVRPVWHFQAKAATADSGMRKKTTDLVVAVAAHLRMERMPRLVAGVMAVMANHCQALGLTGLLHSVLPASWLEAAAAPPSWKAKHKARAVMAAVVEAAEYLVLNQKMPTQIPAVVEAAELDQVGRLALGGAGS